jgi:phage/plasmid-like protein (TIGR03299 family)
MGNDMAHQIANINGTDAMFCVGNRESAWHHLGQRTGEAVKWQEAITLAGLDWDVVKQDVYSRDMEGKVTKLPGIKSVWRDSKPSAFLGTVGEGFELLQNREAFTYVDSLLETVDGAHYETAGALGNGERIWALAKLPADSRIRGTEDVTKNYLLFATAHDGSMANTVKIVRERVVCHNTLTVALGEAGKAFRFKHTKNMRFKMEEARKIMLGINAEIAAHDGVLNTLASRQMTKETMLTVFERLFPTPKGADGRSSRTNNIAAMILQLFESNDNNAIPEIRGSAYNLLNACTEYADHFRTVRNTSGDENTQPQTLRAAAAMFGTGDAFKQEAATAIMELTADCPVHDPLTFVPSAKDLDKLYNL